MKAKELTLEFVNENFYACEGKVCRKDGRSCNNSNHLNQYYLIKFINNTYRAHRILWIIYNQQEIPEGYLIDHVDCNGRNNTKENLRLASDSQNSYNRKIPINNTTGIKCISINRYNNYIYYKCKITKNNKNFQKQFSYTPEGLESAKIWLEEKRKELHGEFARNE